MTEQHDIELRLDHSTRPAIRVGNNAAWMCPCGRNRPLLGSLLIGKGLVACPDCNRRYQLIDVERRNAAARLSASSGAWRS